jgi:hypothetical protein
MADNIKLTVKIGETPTVTATLKDTDPATGQRVAFPLTGWTVYMTVAKGRTVIINQAPCVVDPDQVANKGKVQCTFAADSTAWPGLRKGSYNLEFKGIDPLGGVHYFPKKGSVIYGVMEFAEPLS